MTRLVGMLALLALALSACTGGAGPEASLGSLPVMPGATSPQVSGSQLQYEVQDSCGAVVNFYHAEMPSVGWAITDPGDPDDSVQNLEFERGGETTLIHLMDGSMMMRSGCSVQIFVYQTPTEGTPLWQRILGVGCILAIEVACGVIAGLQTKWKGYSFLVGFLMGFFGSFLGAYLALALSPKRAEGAPPPPGARRRLVILLLLLLVVIVGVVLLAAHNRGVLPW